MEVCGTHTEVITTSGLRSVLPSPIELVTGPGCPVCVTSQEDIDAVVELALADVPVYCYGDVMRVPGTKMSLEQARAQGANVDVVYSTEAVPADNKSVFFAIGFETTAPMTAAAIKRGVTVYSTHKYFPPAMQALVADSDIRIDGFIDPGHVAAIIGTKPFKVIDKPQVVAGFEPVDILQGIMLLLRQISSGRSEVENQYKRLVKAGGNKAALKLLAEVFEPGKATWRGLGGIPRSGMSITREFEDQDAQVKYEDIIRKLPAAHVSRGCICSQVIKGKAKPVDCSLFAKKCTVANPEGACMVSREGACRIAYENR